jgi:iron complex outermembrane receptor protein
MKRFSIALMMSAGSALCASMPAIAQENSELANEGDQLTSVLLDVPLEDLLTLESTSVAKKRQRVSESPAAVFIITQEDIRRSAANTIPDLLRMVPGVEVGNQYTGGTAVSIRGFNSRSTNSLLVMVDGRSIYVSTLSGVFWDQLMLPLNEIERIEVVRGPGATLWGANAVNGVINIITKHSSDSLGTKATARGGSRDQEVSISHGARLDEAVSYRVYGNFRSEDGLVDNDGNDLSNHWQGKSLGVRLDWEPNERDAITIQAEYSDGEFDIPFAFPNQDLLNPGYVESQNHNRFNTQSVLGRWTRRQSETLDWSLQAYFDKLDRVEFGGANLVWKQADVDFGLHWRANDVHDVNIGIGARIIDDSVDVVPILAFDDFGSPDKWVSGYIQDDISLIPEKLRLTVGAKLEYNNFTGVEFQPSAKLFFRPSNSFAIWGGVSRAVRTPSRFERGAHLAINVDLPGTERNPFPLPLYTRLNGSPQREPEKLTAYEVGFRAQIAKDWSVDIASYYNHYEKLTSLELAETSLLFAPSVPFPLGVMADVDFAGNGTANTWGVEAVVSGQVKPWWKMDLTYSHLRYNLRPDKLTLQPPNLLFSLNGSPQHQATLRNAFDISDRLSVDTQLRYVSEVVEGVIPDYLSTDVRVTYRLFDSLEMSLIGENLSDARHSEFTQLSYQTPLAFTPRTVSVEARLRF